LLPYTRGKTDGGNRYTGDVKREQEEHASQTSREAGEETKNSTCAHKIQDVGVSQTPSLTDKTFVYKEARLSAKRQSIERTNGADAASMQRADTKSNKLPAGDDVTSLFFFSKFAARYKETD
jgi:hypothetical protein